MTDANTIPSTPDPTTVHLVMILLRYVLSILAGLGLYHGAVGDSTLTIVASGVVGAAMAGWALWERFRSARLAHQSAVASAAAGRPVQVTKPT